MSPRSPGRWPAGWLGMLAVVALIEVVVGQHRADLAPPWAEDWHYATWAAGRKATRADVLCFGDSLVKYGVLPRVIEAKTGRSAFNLATSGGTLPSSFFLFERALSAGARPKAVVVDFAALMLHDDDPLTLQNYPELASVLDCAGLAWTASDGHFLGSALLAKLLPSYRWRFEIRSWVQARLEGRDGSQRAAGALCRHRWDAAQGAQPMPPGRVRHPNEDFLIDGVSPASWTIERRNDAYLDRFLALAASHQIPVYWLIPPLVPEAHQRRASRGADVAYDRLVRSKLARHPNLIVLDARAAGYDDSVHIDHIHLDRVGATALSASVAAIVDQRLRGQASAPAWVQLPAYPGPTAPDSLARDGGLTRR